MSERRGKSWKREREEREKRQQKATTTSIPSNHEIEADSSQAHCTEDINTQAESSHAENAETHSDTTASNNHDENNCVQQKDEVSNEEDETNQVSEESILEEEKKELMLFISEVNEKFKMKRDLRTVNANAEANRPEESFFSRLDSSLKKNTAFIKRLRNMTDAQRDSLIKDMESLNLTKYISEAASAIVEAKLKMSDVNTAVQICSLLHQRYSDFSGQLLEHWQKILPVKKDDKISNPSKTRVDLRFFAELVCCSIFHLKEGLPLLGNLLTLLTTGDKEEHANISIVLSFCRHCGDDYAGLMPRKMKRLAEKFGIPLPKSDFLKADRQKGLRHLLKEYYKSLCKHLLRDYKALQNLEKQYHRILQTKGELSNDKKEKFESTQIAFQKLLSNTEQFADIVDEDVPPLPKDESLYQDTDSTHLDVYNRFKDKDMLDGSMSVWEDEDTRSFYENLPDLKAFIPGILFKDSSQTQAQVQPEVTEKLEEDMSKLEIEDVELLEAEATEIEEMKDASKGDEKDLTETLMQEIDEPEEESTHVSVANKVLLESFLKERLLHCVNREVIDQAAVDFCMNLNTRPNRKKLVRTLFLVPRTRLDLLPFYARFVATLNPCMPDVATDLVSMLKQDFKFHIKKKDQINIESKVKTVRFIGELVKFRVFPKFDSLHFLKLLLSDFIHHHIEMACNLLETCGRFLFQAPDSHQRIKVLLEQMMRKKAVLPVDSRYTTMVENAFYYCNPPEAPPMVRVERTPMHEYIRKLLYQDLSKSNTEKSTDKVMPASRVLRQMRKLDWDDADTASYIIKCLTAVWNVKYYNIRCVANLLAGLVPYQEHVGPQVVDGVLEDIRLGMEINHPKYNQRRVSMVRFLGELYNYRMVESAVIFKTLYSFITFGINFDGSYSELDPPEHLFRLRLVCVLLETCGQYFNSGTSKRKLDCFLIFFQRYYWLKRSSEIFTVDFPFPVPMKFLVTDLISSLRPKQRLYESLEEALKAADDLVAELKPKLVEVCPSIAMDEDADKQPKPAPSTPVSKEDNLHPIVEVDEDYDEDAHSVGSFQDGDTEEDTENFSGSQSQPLEDDHTALGRSLSDADGDLEGGCGNGDAPVVKAPTNAEKSAEDEDFMTAFDRMLSDSIMHRNQEAVKPQADIVIPMNIKGSNMKKTILELKEEEKKSTINFVLMTRKGNKQQFKNLAVPVSSELAQNLKEREEAEKMEKQHVKLLTLNINERQEEEDYQEMLASQQRPSVMNLNRDRRQKYHHPKGAPDVDLIFGNKLNSPS